METKRQELRGQQKGAPLWVLQAMGLVNDDRPPMELQQEIIIHQDDVRSSYDHVVLQRQTEECTQTTQSNNNAPIYYLGCYKNAILTGKQFF